MGIEPLISKSECKQAAEEFGQTYFDFNGPWSDATKGCISRDHHVYFNSHEVGDKYGGHHFHWNKQKPGDRHDLYKAICRKKCKFIYFVALNYI